MAKILILGSSGSLGHYVKQYFLENNCFGNEIATLSRGIDADNSFHHYKCDFLNPIAIEKVLNDFMPSKIIHLAWNTNHGSYWSSPENLLWSDATIHLAKKFVEIGGEYLIFAGTCAEYEWCMPVLKEGTTPENPSTLYGQQKLRASKYLLNLNKTQRLQTNSSRVFFPFSAHENENRITSKLLGTLLKNEPLHLRAGDVFREIFHTKYVAEAIVNMTEKNATGLFNIATNNKIHLGDFLALIADVLGKRELLSWDYHDCTKVSEPHILLGDGKRVSPYLSVPEDQTNDILNFVQNYMRMRV